MTYIFEEMTHSLVTVEEMFGLRVFPSIFLIMWGIKYSTLFNFTYSCITSEQQVGRII